MGAQAGVWLTGGKLSIAVYKSIFGLGTYLTAYMFYQLTPKAKEKKKKSREAAKRFAEKVKEVK